MVREIRKDILDPRTKLLLTVVSATIMFSTGAGIYMEILSFAMSMLPIFMGLLYKRWSFLVKYSAVFFPVYAVSRIAEAYAASIGLGGMAITALLWGVLKFMPGICTAYLLLKTTKISDLLCALDRMKLTSKLTIPIAVLFRFMPTLKAERLAIKDAMKMRGIGGFSFKSFEYRMVPLLMISMKIGDDLSASALCRGLGAPVERTHISNVYLSALDIIMIVLAFTGLFVLIASKTGIM